MRRAEEPRERFRSISVDIHDVLSTDTTCRPRGPSYSLPSAPFRTNMFTYLAPGMVNYYYACTVQGADSPAALGLTRGARRMRRGALLWSNHEASSMCFVGQPMPMHNAVIISSGISAIRNSDKSHIL